MVNDKVVPFCSTIIPTVGRKSLSRAVESVLNQKLPGHCFEVVVVNDSGEPLQNETWQQDSRVQIIHTSRRERSVARNTGAAVARGRYLHFLDDDDWLAPGAFQHFLNLSQQSQARWLYGITQLVDRSQTPTLRLHHELNGNCFTQFMAGEWIPLQSSLIEAQSFFQIGGFNPLIAGPEDLDLLRRIALIGEVAETNHLVAFVGMGEAGSTTNYADHARARRWAREMILELPGVFPRLRFSASHARWQGRVTRTYLTSAAWNLKRGKPLTAASRLAYGLASVFTSGTSVISKEYWTAFANFFVSETFEKGSRQAVIKADPLAGDGKE